MSDNIKLIHGDCIEEMKKIESEVVDLTITSPPYNVNLSYNSYDDNKDYNSYLSFLRECFSEVYRITKSDGRISINIGDAKNGSIPTHCYVMNILQEIGFIPITTIIWNKNTISNRCSWGSYMSAKSPSFPRGFEFILVYGKSKSKEKNGISTITKKEWIEYTNGLWTFPPERNLKDIGHPAAFPLDLPKRLIRMLTYKGEVVFDPFMGSGTTGVASVKNERSFIGIEIDKDYFEIAKKRIYKTIDEEKYRLF